MIPRRYIEEWREFAPWPENGQVEQDLIIERTLVELFSDPFLNENLAFRNNSISELFSSTIQVTFSKIINYNYCYYGMLFLP